VILILDHPQVAFRDCNHCKAWMYDEDTGALFKAAGTNEPVARINGPDGLPLTPCRTKKGCPKGTPEDSSALSPKNWLAYQHYKRCKAVGRFPRDGIVERNAGIISDAEQSVRDRQQWHLTKMIELLAMRP
jgi:hypothetical protein